MTMYYFFGILLSIQNKIFNIMYNVKPFTIFINCCLYLFISIGITLMCLMAENRVNGTFFDNLHIHNMIAVLGLKVYSIILGFYITNFLMNVINKLFKLITLDLFN